MRLASLFARRRTAPPPKPQDIAPMSVREAVEAMKIVAPHCADLVLNAGDNAALMRTLWARVSDESPAQLLRLLGLMEHKEPGVLAREYAESRNTPAFLLRMAEGFARNPLDLMVNAAFHIGLTNETWQVNDG